jgi:CheY-like chemotaxis protein
MPHRLITDQTRFEELCEHIREMPDYQHTPFILLTAKCMEIDVAKLRQIEEIGGHGG